MSSFSEFEEKVKVISNLGMTQELLSWDQEVMMPEKGLEARSKQKSVLSTVQHQKLTEDELGEMIEELEDEELEQDQQAVLREIRREHEKAVKVPEELMEKISEKESTCVETWRKAREENDFEMFAGELRELVELKREYAEYIDPEAEAYEALFRDFEPYIRFETMETILERLRENLTELIEEIRNSEPEICTDAFEGDFPVEKQQEISRELVERLGFEFEHGRLDESTHPFTNGNQYDTRITTRYNEADFSEGLGATVHECGHALYQQGLPRDAYGTPLGQARELSIHESQSRLWENHVMRSREFWNYLLPEMKEEFPEKFDSVNVSDCYQSINQVKEDNLIRIYADELTYHLHIIVRFEVGRALINGDIEVDELPEVWNDKMEELLGIRPENDSEGVMQDIHWAWGSFGYFPTYSLGSVLAAQIYSAAEDELDDLDEKIADGEFAPLREWLRENIHSHGQRYPAEELVEKATGEKPTADYFLEYIREKYGEIYGLDF